MFTLLVGMMLVVPLAVSALPPCVCTRDRRVVCGSDGKTYSSECTLNCAISKDPTLSLRHIGACESVQVVNNPPIPNCACPFNYKPVCGTNGNTYPNECVLKCAQRTNPSIQLSHQGNCNQANQVQVVNNAPASPNNGQRPCTCNRDAGAVCGTDSVTYGNACLLACAAQDKPGLNLLYLGQCVNPLADAIQH